MKYSIKLLDEHQFFIAYGILTYSDCEIEPTIGEFTLKFSVDDELLKTVCIFFAKHLEKDKFEFEGDI